MTNQVNIKVRITNQQIDDIITTSFEGGSNYWIGRVVLEKPGRKETEWASEAVAVGGVLKLWDYEEEKWHQLDKAKFLNGYAMAKSDARGFDLDNYDGDDADRVIQYAVFGKLIYG